MPNKGILIALFTKYSHISNTKAKKNPQIPNKDIFIPLSTKYSRLSNTEARMMLKIPNKDIIIALLTNYGHFSNIGASFRINSQTATAPRLPWLEFTSLLLGW